MLRSNAIKSSIIIANKAAKDNISIKPVLGSLLEQVTTSNLFDIDSSLLLDNDAIENKLIQSSSSATPGIATDHDVIGDMVVSKISTAVKAHIKVIKNVIKPLVVEYAKNVENSIEANKPDDVMTKFNIISYELPNIVTNSEIMDSLTPYISTQNNRFTLISTKYPIFNVLGLVVSYEELLEAYPTMKEDIVNLFSNIDIAILSDIEKVIFANADNTQLQILLSTANPFKSLPYYIVLYLVVLYLYDNPKDNAGVSLNVWKDDMATLRASFGSAIMKSYTLARNYINANLLVLDIKDYPSKNIRSDISVIKPVYKKWLEDETHKPEVILGLAVSTTSFTPSYSVNAINNKIAEYLKNWEQYLALNVTKLANEYNSILSNIIMSEFLKTISNNQWTDIENEHIKEREFITSDYINYLKSEVEAVLPNLIKNNTVDIYTVALYLVAKIRFGFTKAYSFLTYMEDASRVNPNIDANGAALIATLKYVVYYFLYQTNIEKIS